jgi:hypothetical protein
MRKAEGKTFYFHVYKQPAYLECQHRNRHALLYCHQAPVPHISAIFSESFTESLLVIQAMQSTFRWTVRTRDCIVASSDCFEPSREFNSADLTSSKFTRALINCHLLHSIYPPFSADLKLQMRQQLEKHVEPYSRGVMRRMKEVMNKMQKTIDPLALDSDASSVYSIENSTILEEDGKPAKKTILGKMFGRFKSPLSKHTGDKVDGALI